MRHITNYDHHYRATNDAIANLCNAGFFYPLPRSDMSHAHNYDEILKYGSRLATEVVEILNKNNEVFSDSSQQQFIPAKRATLSKSSWQPWMDND